MPVVHRRVLRTDTCLYALDDDRGGFAAADADRGEANALVHTLESIHERDDDARAAGTDRVAQRDRTAQHIELLVRDTQLILGSKCHDSKGLIDLEEVDLIEREAEDLFQKFFTGQKNILATNVTLDLWLSPEIFVRELYRTKPEVLFIGDLQPDAGNKVSIHLEYMERGKVYEVLFRSTVPARDGGRFRLAKATLTYDVPAMGVTAGRVEANIAVESSADEARTLMRNGDVRRVITQAETQRQLLFLQDKRDLIERGQATQKDKDIVARLLDALVKKFDEQGDQANLNLYRQMRDDYSSRGVITQEMMNRSLAASSKVEGAIAVQEVDDF